jgi:outer membrane protein assembly factor BamB
MNLISRPPAEHGTLSIRWKETDTEVTKMVAAITKRDGDSVTVSVTVRLDGPMLESEEAIQGALNEAGMLLEQENLVRFDTDGSPIQVGPVRLTSKGQSPQIYETPYGPVGVERHVYQTAQGGKTYCPLESDARLILNATPRWAKVVSYKYAGLGADSVVDDLRECEQRLNWGPVLWGQGAGARASGSRREGAGRGWFRKNEWRERGEVIKLDQEGGR